MPKKPAAKHKSHDGFHSVSKDGTHDLMGGPLRGKKPLTQPAAGPMPMPDDNDGDENPMTAAPGAYMQ